MATPKFLDMENITDEHRPICGSKALELRKVYALRLNVPPFFVLTQGFFESVLELCNARTEFDYLQTRLKADGGLKALERLSRLVSGLEIPPTLGDELYKNYLKLGRDPSQVKSAFDLVKQQREVFVAVRCSDPNPYLDTYTNIRGRAELERAVKLCWASFFNERAFQQSEGEPIALIVQRMLLTEKAAEVDSSEPGLLRVKAFWGQTGFVRQLNPDIYFLTEQPLEISSKTVGLQTEQFILDPKQESFVKKSLGEDIKGKSVLNETELRTVMEMATRVREHFGRVAVEIGFSEGRAYVVNVRRERKKQTALEENNAPLEAHQEPSQEPTHFDEALVENAQGLLDQLSIASGNAEPDSGYVEEAAVLPPMSEGDTETESPPVAESPIFEEPHEGKGGGVAATIEAVFEKYITINPALKPVLELLKQELLERI